MELEKASNIAVDLCYRLQPYVEIINIAGSIRRKKAEVGDIEIICIPKMDNVSVASMFGDSVEGSTVSKEFCEKVFTLGIVKRGKPTGRMMQIDLPEAIMLDLFIPEAADYYRQYAIRTGSAEYSHKIIAAGWNSIGWCGSDKGLRKIADCKQVVSNGGLSKTWKCMNDRAELPPIWNSEKEFFDWIKVEFVHPTKRNL